MKIPIAVSLLILALGAGVGWSDHQRLAAARKSQASLIAEAGRLGIALDPAHPASLARITKHDRESREASASLSVAEFIAFAMELEAFEKTGGGQPDAAMQQRIMDFMNSIMALNATQLKTLIAEVGSNKELKDETRQSLIGFSIMTLANDHPAAALALFAETSALFKDPRTAGQIVSSSLARWAKDDPMAALAWVRNNTEKFPALVTDDTKRGMIFGAAAKYPKLAFKLIGELDFKDSNIAIQGIVGAAKTPEERTSTLTALRAHLASLRNESARNDATNLGLRVLVQGVTQDGFEAGSRWLDNANLSQAELRTLADGLNSSIKGGDTGQWIEWLGKTLPPDLADANIRSFVSNWCQNDCQAAGKWLGNTPDGPTKTLSISAFAVTVSRYDPDVAAQWALTLPDGDVRDATLKAVYGNWAQKDPRGAAAFAKQNGIR